MTTPSPDALLVDLQRHALAEISRHLPPVGRWCAVDYPMHFNVGDAAIIRGQSALARHVGAEVVQVLDRRSYRRDRIPGDALPVIAGGGTWGGLYPTHHRLRLRLLEDTRGRPVVQMPQSVHHASDETREELRRAVGRHGALTLLVRDRRSYELAVRDYDCEVHLVPDLVFALGPMRAPAPVRDVVVQARTDREAPVVGPGLGEAPFDWLEPPASSLSRAALQAAELTNRLNHRAPVRWGGRANVAATSTLARLSVARGLRLLSRGRYVVTDRLHGHVLARSIGRPHVVVDDRFGKIRALHETWLRDDDRSILVASWGEVPRALDRLRERFPPP